MNRFLQSSRDCGQQIFGKKFVIGHKHGNEIYVIARFVINSLWKEIIACLWVHHIEE
jgi:hypothetical protein